MKNKLTQSILNFNFILVIYLIVTLLVSIQSYFGGIATFNGLPYTYYNNYVIFKQSFFHLIQHKDLYTLYPLEHWDYYKYSPSFALLMAPLAVLPDYLGLLLWDLMNVIPLFVAVKYLPKVNETNKKYILWFIILELITSLQNEQSNGLISGLIILAFVLFERNHFFWGTLLIVFSAYIKLFGILAIVILLLYPNKVRNIAYTLFWAIVLLILPLLVISAHQLSYLYQSWKGLLAQDVSSSVGYSVAGWFRSWFGLSLAKLPLMLTGLILFFIPLMRVELYKEFYFKLLFVASILIWIVIFNPKAESPTFIIAICGVALWYFPQIRKIENLALIIIALIFTVLSPTDIFPHFIRKNFFRPYVIKAVPCIFIWLKLVYDMIFYKRSYFEEHNQ